MFWWPISEYKAPFPLDIKSYMQIVSVDLVSKFSSLLASNSFLIKLPSSRASHIRWMEIYLSEDPQRSYRISGISYRLIKLLRGNGVYNSHNSKLSFHGRDCCFYNKFHNILRLFDVSPNFLFTTSETKQGY